MLLSAVTGHAALRVFTRSSVEVVTTSGVLAEVREYLPAFARASRVAPEALEAQLRLLALKAYEEPAFAASLPESRKRIGDRDPDDVGLLALALSLDVPVWSNDDDFRDAGVPWFTTARLLRILGLQQPR